MDDQLEYTPDELRTINEEFWQSNRLWLDRAPRLPCPRCGATARLLLVDGSPPELHITCPRCKASGIVSAVEETTEHDLPPEKVAEFVDRHHSGLESYCPICRTLLTVEEHGSFEGDSYFILCPRCHVSGQTG